MLASGHSLIDRATRQDDAEAELVALRRERRRLDLRMARLLARIDAARHYAFRGCSSIAQYGESVGLSGREARTLAAAGRAVGARPELEEDVLAGRLSVDAVASLSRVFGNPALAPEAEEWISRARRMPARELEHGIRCRLREIETGEAVSVLTAILTASGREKFERARQIICRKTGRLVPEGHAVEVLSDHYLDSFDPARREPRARRAGDTAGSPGRHVPEEAKRAVLARQGDRCAVPGCDHRIWTEYAHVRPHRNGGSREAENLVYLCRQHHVLFDAGLLRVSGTPDRPVFETDSGAPVAGARAPP